ncbi:hypothetical protein LshimejAT787_0602580 [Lyophyllum shimeji]|uniref:Uncharacterized protein n=1 Tax=Lyophyllum shimeji TaxID=47721 RepID=A0A9P3PNY6_LYOSH|nr:hypothetical protein LshimejAT787_0602580 [Lyophyllum shimeji]
MDDDSTNRQSRHRMVARNRFSHLPSTSPEHFAQYVQQYGGWNCTIEDFVNLPMFVMKPSAVALIRQPRRRKNVSPDLVPLERARTSVPFRQLLWRRGRQRVYQPGHFAGWWNHHRRSHIDPVSKSSPLHCSLRLSPGGLVHAAQCVI